MEKKIDIAAILKDCPRGMELDSPMFEGLEFDSIVNDDYFSIRCRIKHPDGGYNVFNFTKYGCWTESVFSKCVIFPKGKATWEGFVSPCQFKDGDILVDKSGYPFIFKSLNNTNGCCSYCGIDCLKNFKLDSNDWTFADSLRFASEKEKEKLFKIIKDNGYKWDAETKSLEKLIAPKFKNGDRIKDKNNKEWFVGQVFETHFDISSVPNAEGCFVSIEDQDYYELVPNKFDITTLKPFDKVLVRDNNTMEWDISFFSHCNGLEFYKYSCLNGNGYAQCIPYEENKHLLGKTNKCAEFYMLWEE